MADQPTPDLTQTDIAAMRASLSVMRQDFMENLPVGSAIRKDRLRRAVALLVDHGEALSSAMSEDFGHRSREQSMLTDINSSIMALKHALSHVDSWMRSDRRKPLFPLGLLGAKARVDYQPKGVVGIIAPWNYPVSMVMAPLSNVLAAGNRAMIKPSEFTPRTADMLKQVFPSYFDELEIDVVTGGAAVGAAFAALPFDHIIFTGATGIGRHILHAAADNLTPVTLELGGKSPVIIGHSANIAQMADRIVTGKMMNAGQTCLAPDYLLVTRDAEAAIVDAIAAAASTQYPTLLTNPDYTAVVNDRHHARLTGYLDDARAKGATIRVINPANEDFASANSRKMPLHIVTDVTDDMQVMQEEIFGPILPVVRIADTAAAIDYVNRRERPLGLYYFGSDSTEEAMVLDRTISGGVTVNDVVFHVAMEDLPFGGSGSSGMGHYHGFDGFKTFSHAKAVYRQPKLDVTKLAGMKPPYNATTAKNIARAFRK